MIRHKPTFMALNGFGLAFCAFLILALPFRTLSHPILPLWVNEALYAALCAMFLYNILKHIRGPIEPTPFVRSIGERNLWAIKGTLIGLLVIVMIAVLVHTPHRW